MGQRMYFSSHGRPRQFYSEFITVLGFAKRKGGTEMSKAKLPFVWGTKGSVVDEAMLTERR
ncbi:MAG: hypothetical protein Kow0099_14780 [Candidatus Abyssubacteria bacterium]